MQRKEFLKKHPLTLPLFIEGVRRSREGVTSVARSVLLCISFCVRLEKTYMRKAQNRQPINLEDKAKTSRNRGCVMKYP